VLFLDEPTTGLDPEARAAMWEEIGRLAAEEAVTVLLTTHHLEEADRVAGRLALVDAGRVVVEGTPEELKRGLSGDTVQVTLAQAAPPPAVAALAAVRGLSGVTAEGPVLRARAAGAPDAVPAVLAALAQADVEVLSVTVGRPSLDDVYLHHVGRSLEVAA
jgi:ABC-2 type transport system ATP-binding protein